MERKDGTPVTKTTVKVWRPLVAKLEARMNETCLRRDLYLSRLLVTELDHLDREVAVANSHAAYAHVFERLDALDRKPMSLALPPDVVDKVNEVCTRKRIVRDAFFNRLFLLLAASPASLDTLFFPTYGGDWKRDVWRAYGDDPATVAQGVLPLASVGDPFWALREVFELDRPNLVLHDRLDPGSGQMVAMEEVQPGCYSLPARVYTRYLDQKAGAHDLLGFNCYVPDWRLPGQGAARSAEEHLLDAILSGH